MQRYTSMGMTSIQHLTEGMCRKCAWERIKQKCKLCGEIIGKGYPKLLAHTAAHYTSSQLLYNEEIEKNIILVNFEIPKPSNQVFGQNRNDYDVRCKVCQDRFPLKKEDVF